MLTLENQEFNQQLNFTQGDDVVLALRAIGEDGEPADLTGASLSTDMLAPNGLGVVNFNNSKHTIGNQTTNRGGFLLTLEGADTGLVGEGLDKTILTVVTVGGELSTYRGINLLNVYSSVPPQ